MSMLRRVRVPPFAWGLLFPSYTVQTLRVAWCILVFWMERGYFYTTTSSCDLEASSTATFRILVLSDPQIVGTHTYETYSQGMTALVSAFSDQYLRKAWLAITRQGLGASLWRRPRRADLVVLLGDLTDRGRWYDSYTDWNQLQLRWMSLFRNLRVMRYSLHSPLRPGVHDGSWPALIVPGNHDVGIPAYETGKPSALNELAAGWFQHDYAPLVDDDDYFLKTNGTASWNARIPISVNHRTTTHELVLLNAMDLVTMQSLGHGPIKNWDSAKERARNTTKMIDLLGSVRSPAGQGTFVTS